MRYDHTITVSYSADSVGAGGSIADGTTTTVYSGPADVQMGGGSSLSDVLREIGGAGLEGRGNAVVYLPDDVDVLDEGIKEGNDFTWDDTSQSGRIVAVSPIDDAFEVSIE